MPPPRPTGIHIPPLGINNLVAWLLGLYRDRSAVLSVPRRPQAIHSLVGCRDPRLDRLVNQHRCAGLTPCHQCRHGIAVRIVQDSPLNIQDGGIPVGVSPDRAHFEQPPGDHHSIHHHQPQQGQRGDGDNHIGHLLAPQVQRLLGGLHSQGLLRTLHHQGLLGALYPGR